VLTPQFFKTECKNTTFFSYMQENWQKRENNVQISEKLARIIANTQNRTNANNCDIHKMQQNVPQLKNMPCSDL